jgi:hypothetical protein
MVSAFERSIRPVGNEDHGDEGGDVRNHHEDSNRGIRVLAGGSLHSLRHPEDPVLPYRPREVGCCQVPNSRVGQRLTYADSFLCCFSLFLKRQFRCEAVCFLRRKKSDFRRSAWHQEIGGNPAHDGRNALQNEQPSPTAETQPMNCDPESLLRSERQRCWRLGQHC